MELHPQVIEMSQDRMEKDIYEILTNEGKSDEEADIIIDGMDLEGMQQFLSDVFWNVDDDKEDE